EADKDFGKYIYPLMQVTDIFRLEVDICMGGMDQRHAHMLARDIADKIGAKKAISLHGPLLGSLKGNGRMDSENFKKMSKSDPDSGILINDSPEEIKRKISNAFCPILQVAGNPVFEIAKYVLFPRLQNMEIKRPRKKRGNYNNRKYLATC
ncbi:tyrosyl-tRNA synthetase, partial [mine drainage metagenome]